MANAGQINHQTAEMNGPFWFLRLLFILLMVVNCWIWMQAIHELGHAVVALASGGHVVCVILHIAAISRMDVLPNPHPLLVCWAGPVLGCLLPYLAATASMKFSRRPLAKFDDQSTALGDAVRAPMVVLSFVGLLRFFAGFCLIANGAYVSVGSLDRVGDAGDLLRLGSPLWLLWLVGAVGVGIGLGVWHNLGGLSDLLSIRIRFGTLQCAGYTVFLGDHSAICVLYEAVNISSQQQKSLPGIEKFL